MAFDTYLTAVRRKIAQVVRGSALAARVRRGLKRLLLQPLRRALGTAGLADRIGAYRDQPALLDSRGEFQGMVELSVQAQLTEIHRALNSLLRGVISLVELQEQQGQARLTTHTQVLRQIDTVRQDLMGITEQLDLIRQDETRVVPRKSDPLRLLVRNPPDKQAC